MNDFLLRSLIRAMSPQLQKDLRYTWRKSAVSSFYSFSIRTNEFHGKFLFPIDLSCHFRLRKRYLKLLRPIEVGKVSRAVWIPYLVSSSSSQLSFSFQWPESFCMGALYYYCPVLLFAQNSYSFCFQSQHLYSYTCSINRQPACTWAQIQ